MKPLKVLKAIFAPLYYVVMFPILLVSYYCFYRALRKRSKAAEEASK